MTFDIRQLRYAIAAANHGSFYRAARALDVEQSTLSRKILKLERAVGMPIFERSRAGVTLTLAGGAFIRGAKPMVASADTLIAMMRAAGQGRAGGLMIGHNSPLSAGYLRATLFGWRVAVPDVEVDGMEDGREALLAGLDSGVIDIAILAGEAGYLGIRRAAFWSERIMVAMPMDHPLAKQEFIRWIDLRHETFLLPAKDPGPEIRDMLIGRLSSSGFSPQIKMHAVTRDALLSVLGGGLGVTITCESAAGSSYPNVVMREVHGSHGQTLISFSGYWRADNANPALRRFLTFVRDRYALSFDVP